MEHKEQKTAIMESEDAIQATLNKQAKRKSLLTQWLPFLGFAFVAVFFLIATQGGMLSPTNLSNLVEQCFTITVVAVGSTFIYSCGQFDISVGNVMAFGQLVIAYLMKSDMHVPIIVLLLAGIAVTMACTFVTGFVTAYLKVPSIIVSLCMMSVCSGIVQTAVSKNDIYIPYNDYTFLNSAAVKGPVLVLIILIGLILFNKTRLGRDLKAVGGNQVAAAQSGINSQKTIILGFLALGVCLGIAAFFSIVRVGMLTGTSGGGLGLNILVAIVLGGFPLTGGANSRMSGAIIGALTVMILSNGMTLVGVDPTASMFVKGILFLVIVQISYERSKGKLVL
jgi:ribose transport system permease protein